jgi:hypothetical protein
MTSRLPATWCWWGLGHAIEQMFMLTWGLNRRQVRFGVSGR